MFDNSAVNLSVSRRLLALTIFSSVKERLLCAGYSILFLSLAALPMFGQTQPVLVQPGAPGEQTKSLPLSTRVILPQPSPKDIEFMQGMIMHHAQAVEMTAWIEERTTNAAVRLLGSRISQSQADEMKFMARWLAVRDQPAEMPMPAGSGGHAHHEHKSPTHKMIMPGMLTDEQMEALKNSSGAKFDRLFLTGMIQHHEGALVMVDDLFKTSGAGQDAELFNFATDVDSGQRAEIRSMETLLGKKS